VPAQMPATNTSAACQAFTDGGTVSVARPSISGRPARHVGRSGTLRATAAAVYRYWPVLPTVSIERPASLPLPETRVRM